MSQHVWWYTARAAGIVAYTLLAAAVIWGLSLTTRLTRTPRPAWVLDLHRFLGALAVVFTGVHLAGLAADSYVHFGPSQLFVPLASTWKPDAVAWGIVGFYVLVAVEATSLVMRWLPRKLWRGIHFGSFLLFVLASVHLFAAGTDARALTWFAGTAIAIVVFLTLVRTLAERSERPAPSPAPASPGTTGDRSPAPDRSPGTDRRAMIERARAARAASTASAAGAVPASTPETPDPVVASASGARGA